MPPPTRPRSTWAAAAANGSKSSTTPPSPARGIDSNRDLIRGCREQGLDAHEGAVPQVLSELPDRSLSIVTAFHVLEHLCFADMLEVIDQAVRLLKPGGIAIFETPNPKNLAGQYQQLLSGSDPPSPAARVNFSPS